MSFASFAEFIAMGGHGLYVWLAYGATLLVVLSVAVATRTNGLRLRRELKMMMRRQTNR